MSADLERRIARVLVRSQHGTLPASKIEELVDLGVGMATARLVLDELFGDMPRPAEPTMDLLVAEQRGIFERRS